MGLFTTMAVGRVLPFALLLGLATALPSCGAASEASAAAGEATPADLSARLKGARPGQVIRLAPGDYGVVTFPKRRFDPAVRIDAEDARFTGLVLRNAGGVHLVGGAVTGPGEGYGVSIRDASDIRIENMTISGATRGIVVHESSDIALVGNELTGLISDGINLALSRRVLVDGNRCTNFNPTPAVYDSNGKRIRDGHHADCIQAWSRPEAPPSADLTIVNNVAEGDMQGIFLGNHVRNGVDDGGFDRVTIRDNKVTVSFPTGIRVSDARGAVVTGNVVKAVPGSMLRNKPHIPVKANLLVHGENVVACGNTVVNVPRAVAGRRCD